ncbi:helix-turn-helix protein [Kribbella voronezhensis]|uniref:Helix-turn-helix protein n=1 Tax=Kribbella voronezhensis TaxID=2512212 RepID=A0A4R7TCW6_9ACTN|nr:XRE family transcriptional regulator [Kribbella voronezhensis]TDU89962.1 helix-turn-helix protein [Kribbella voronezhensis]
MSIAPAFAQLLRRFRSDNGLTQERLAELSDLSIEAVKTLESGRRRHPRPATVEQLAAALALDDAEGDQLRKAARRTKIGKAPSLGVRRQLPPPITDFTGRSQHLDTLIELLEKPDRESPGIVVSAIGGMGGIGKTTLAVQAAHQVAEIFRDGQLYLNLRGASPDPVSTEQALDTLLEALGLAPAAAADDLSFTAGRYRTALAGRSILLMLDDAASVEQIVPLLPGTAGAVVIVTSRSPLATLPGARRLALDVLTESEALDLLGEVVGADKVAAERSAAIEVVQYCGLLPLAIRIAAGYAGTSPLSALAARLGDTDGISDVLTGPHGEVRRILSLSLDRLAGSDRRGDQDAATAFPVLALFDGDHFPLRAAAAVLGRSLDDTEDLLDRLFDACLLESPAIHQYRMHDLVREIGRALAITKLSEHDRQELKLRELACYSSVLWRHTELLTRADPYGSRAQRWSEGAEDLADPTQMTGWLEAELPNLRRLVHSSTDDEALRLLAVRIALGMSSLAVALMRFAEARSALTAIALLPIELPAEMEIGRLYHTALMCSSLGLTQECLDWLRRATAVARERGGPEQLARCLLDLGQVLGQTGRPDEGMPYAEEGRALLDQVAGGSRFLQAAQLITGMLAGQLGDLDRQREIFDDLLTRLPGTEERGRDASHLGTMAQSLRTSGRHHKALEVLRIALVEVRELGFEVLEAQALIELASIHLDLHDFPPALEAIEAGLRIASRYPAENREAPLLKLLGDVLAATGEPTEARKAWEQAIVRYDREADPRASEVRKLLSAD